MKDFQFITNSHPSYVETLYNEYVANPQNVDQDYIKFFEGFDFAVNNGLSGKSVNNTATAIPSNTNLDKEFKVYKLIEAYRRKGHLIATTNPIRKRVDRAANLALTNFGLSDADLNSNFVAGSFCGIPNASLQQIITHLTNCYAINTGVEFTYINNDKKLDWLINAIEKDFSKPFSVEKKRRILEKLNQGVIFEQFLHKKYVGQKRFSLEGGETTIAALDAIINTAGDNEVKEIVIGMAHRGRLNILANTLGKTYEHIFSEFEGTSIPDQTMGSGDVKYHMGYSSKVATTNGKELYLKLMPNPSHLEAVDPVVVGYARAKADTLYESDFDKILPILIHGDASVAGQGIVYEVLQMSNLKGYYTGGTIHFVINNQIGFTTDFDDARSSDYCTSIAATVNAPVFHVNGDDPEAVVKAVEIATLYRQEFNSDIFIDMVCYRKHGHNEGDDPKFTQPQLYSLIEKHPNPREVYTQYLINNGTAEAQTLAKEMESKFWDDLQERLDDVKQNPLPYKYQAPDVAWRALRKATVTDFEQSPDTAISKANFELIFNAIMHLPEDFKPLRKIEKLIQDKIKLYADEQKIDWATAELMAYGSILLDGKDVRMSGQDVRRGTFSHRHAVLRDEESNKAYSRLSNIKDAKGDFRIYNSLLSEYGVLGFEYGYSLANPNALVLWEAQFGDFTNGAQTMIDQFISAGEQKWNKMNGITMLLPHGYEGQGPEHSSARLERFLQQCAELNMIVTNITTAANFFHVLRRQVAFPFRKPMINFSPKANLRHAGTYSDASEFTNGNFKEVIDDTFCDTASVKTVLFCTGKIYFDLADKQNKDNRKDVAVVRLEQIYPLPTNQLQELYVKYKNATWFWVQEEPLNMGAASFLQMNLKTINYGVISRTASASTATGYAKQHAKEQNEIIETAFSF
jgi:2-oxoglutarate dehydrogenase E1 component